MRIAATLIMLALVACAVRPGSGTGLPAPHAELLESLGGASERPLALDGAVTGPDGSWQVALLSVPGRGVRVTRRHGQAHTRYTRTGDDLWREGPGTGSIARLPPVYEFFLGLHEMPRLANRLAAWQPLETAGTTRVDGQDCRVLRYRDEFDRPAEVCVDTDTGLPVLVSLDPPEAYGGENLHILPGDWARRDGRVYLVEYRVWHGMESYDYRWGNPRFPENAAETLAPPANLPAEVSGLSEVPGGR